MIGLVKTMTSVCGPLSTFISSNTHFFLKFYGSVSLVLWLLRRLRDEIGNTNKWTWLTRRAGDKDQSSKARKRVDDPATTQLLPNQSCRGQGHRGFCGGSCRWETRWPGSRGGRDSVGLAGWGKPLSSTRLPHWDSERTGSVETRVTRRPKELSWAWCLEAWNQEAEAVIPLECCDLFWDSQHWAQSRLNVGFRKWYFLPLPHPLPVSTPSLRAVTGKLALSDWGWNTWWDGLKK